ncbi:TetR/AcrR family transcriptional regulator [Galbibacter sp. EGI 63066]|uniref:TetR/AcrR family transcriptional regulator n=1 Tax=Galbibacter sp. EGI 63066 TaxID=2993559 RepID=UPI0022494109|nr:TetR/AcrR family transcriptional regulator [Galbibacter sp. EGI 63066]MCX2680773.1 TetR/AcrR family transcriptional regulator [Galbibacter sp. EGI 63066]
MQNSDKDKTKKATPKKKPRKTHSGPIRDKARTKGRLVEAVGKVIKNKGYAALTGPNIAKESGLHKKLIWTYFGGIDNLVEEYLQQKDFWRVAEKEVIQELMEAPEEIGKNEIYSLLESQFKSLLSDELLRKIIHWELEGENKVLRKIADQREEVGEQLFKIIEPEFLNVDGVDLRATLALQIGGLYYMALHAKSNGSTSCGIDVNEEIGEKRVLNALKEIIYHIYNKAKVKK